MLKIGHDPQTCANVIMSGNSVAPGPISQLLGTMTRPGVKFDGSNFDPYIMVLAAGRCNHAGAGKYPWNAPEGNASSIGIEWCGPTSYWPDLVIEFRARVTAAILRHNGWGVHQSCIHNQYAPTRKIDPSGAWHQEQNLPLLGHWNYDKWRNEITKYVKLPEPIINPPLTPSNPTEDEMKPQMYRFPGAWNVFLLSAGGWIHGSGVLVEDWTAQGFGPTRVLDAHAQSLKACLHQCGLVLNDLSRSGENYDYWDPSKNGGVYIP
jgi:hypothetical protein